MRHLTLKWLTLVRRRKFMSIETKNCSMAFVSRPKDARDSVYWSRSDKSMGKSYKLLHFFFFNDMERLYLVFFIFNTMVYSVVTQRQYISFLATCFGFYKTIFRPMLNIGRYIQCVHILWDSIVFT